MKSYLIYTKSQSGKICIFDSFINTNLLVKEIKRIAALYKFKLINPMYGKREDGTILTVKEYPSYEPFEEKPIGIELD